MKSDDDFPDLDEMIRNLTNTPEFKAKEMEVNQTLSHIHENERRQIIKEATEAPFACISPEGAAKPDMSVVEHLLAEEPVQKKAPPPSDEYRRLRDEYATLLSNFDSLQKQSAEQQAAHGRYVDENLAYVKSLEASNKQLKDKVEGYERKTSGLEKTLSEQQRTISRQQSEIGKLTQKVQTLETDYKSLESRLGKSLPVVPVTISSEPRHHSFFYRAKNYIKTHFQKIKKPAVAVALMLSLALGGVLLYKRCAPITPVNRTPIVQVEAPRSPPLMPPAYIEKEQAAQKDYAHQFTVEDKGTLWRTAQGAGMNGNSQIASFVNELVAQQKNYSSDREFLGRISKDFVYFDSEGKIQYVQPQEKGDGIVGDFVKKGDRFTVPQQLVQKYSLDESAFEKVETRQEKKQAEQISMRQAPARVPATDSYWRTVENVFKQNYGRKATAAEVCELLQGAKGRPGVLKVNGKSNMTAETDRWGAMALSDVRAELEQKKGAVLSKQEWNDFLQKYPHYIMAQKLGKDEAGNAKWVPNEIDVTPMLESRVNGFLDEKAAVSSQKEGMQEMADSLQSYKVYREMLWDVKCPAAKPKQYVAVKIAGTGAAAATAARIAAAYQRHPGIISLEEATKKLYVNAARGAGRQVYYALGNAVQSETGVHRGTLYEAAKLDRYSDILTTCHDCGKSMAQIAREHQGEFGYSRSTIGRVIRNWELKPAAYAEIVPEKVIAQMNRMAPLPRFSAS